MKGVDRIVVDKLKKITVISFAFMIIQILGGYYANSIAIFADAFHLLSDVLAYVISLVAVLMSYKASPRDLTFGYEKLQPLGALINVGIIWFVTVELFIEATQRIFKQQVVQEPKYMLLTSIFGLLCNLYIMNVLHSDEHAGGHHNCSHSHHHQSHQTEESHHKHEHGSSCSHNHDHSAHKEHHHHEQKQQQHKECKHDHGHHKHEQEKKKEHKCSHNHDHEHHHHDHQHKSHHEHENEHESHREIVPNTHSHSHGEVCSSSHLGFEGRTDKLNDEFATTANSPASDEQIKGKKKSKQVQDKFHNNINIKAAYIHIITDIILSIGVIISAGIIYFFAPEGHVWSYWQIADPVCTYLFSFMAIYTTIPILKESFNFLLDGCDDIHIIDEIEEELRDNQTVEKVESLRVWSTTRGKYYGALRVKVRQGSRRELKHIFSSRKIEGFVELVEEQEGLRAQH